MLITEMVMVFKVFGEHRMMADLLRSVCGTLSGIQEIAPTVVSLLLHH